MKKTLLFLVLFATASAISAQKVDSIYFHLYTDSLKKGQHNYINVDGKLSNGHWQPLTAKEIEFTCANADFEGTELVIPPNFSDKKVTVKAVLKANPAVWIETTIWIKQKPDPALPTRNEMLDSGTSNKTRRRN